jgi:hypothetical protein
MRLDQLPDDFTPEQFMQLDKESLDKIPFDRKRWLCQCKGCSNGTHIRDYGLSPFYFLDRNSKRSFDKTADYWSNLNTTYWLCGKHAKWIKKLGKTFESNHIQKRLLDMSGTKIVDA